MPAIGIRLYITDPSGVSFGLWTALAERSEQ